MLHLDCTGWEDYFHWRLCTIIGMKIAQAGLQNVMQLGPLILNPVIYSIAWIWWDMFDGTRNAGE